MSIFARVRQGGKVRFGVVEGDRVRPIVGDPDGPWEHSGPGFALAEAELLVPATPSKVLAVGLNYRSHLGGRPEPTAPEIFLKAPSCLIPTGAEVVLPAGAENVHPEGEMVVVIGRRARDVPAERAGEYVLGVTCGNDVSARDWQKGDLQWWRAKGSDTFGPCGPFLATGVDFDDLLLRTRVNGEVRQEQRTSDLIFPVARILAWVTRHLTLEPGDLIYTGTPGTTAALRPGDVVEVELEGVGTLSNRVVAAR